MTGKAGPSKTSEPEYPALTSALAAYARHFCAMVPLWDSRDIQQMNGSIVIEKGHPYMFKSHRQILRE